MNGVLERMAKRALGRLPTVQPVIRSIYAAALVNTGEPPAPGFPTDKVEAESLVEVPERPPARVSKPQPDAPQRSRAAASPKPGRTAGPPERRAELANPQAERQPPQRPRVEPVLRPTTPPAPQLEAADRPVNPEPLPQIALTVPVIPMRQDDVAPVFEESTPAAPASTLPARISPPVASPRERRRMRAVRVESPTLAEQKAEIHISIGSIELRAAPAEPKPAPAAPFRPRVSLQDFLSRKTEPRR